MQRRRLARGALIKFARKLFSSNVIITVHNFHMSNFKVNEDLNRGHCQHEAQLKVDILASIVRSWFEYMMMIDCH